MTGWNGNLKLSRRDGTVNKNVTTGRDSKTKIHEGTGRYIFFCSTGRDGANNFSRRDGTVFITSSTTGRDGTFFFDDTGRYIFVFMTGRDGYIYIY